MATEEKKTTTKAKAKDLRPPHRIPGTAEHLGDSPNPYAGEQLDEQAEVIGAPGR